MSKFSQSFTVGKASSQHGGNVEHNNRKFFSDNVDRSKSADNITYICENIEDAYHKLFDNSLEKYNGEQKRRDRKIPDYYQHIKNGKREEEFYEIVVQFGDSKNAPVGSENAKTVQKMLEQYMKNFQKRNPNLHVFNAVLHLDEASPHLHIDFIPFYTKGKTNGLSRGVSMKAALDEQGFKAKNYRENRLVAWEKSEMCEMEKILNENNLERDVKNAKHLHKSVADFKEEQDAKILKTLVRKNENSHEISPENFRKLLLENSLLQNDLDRLSQEKSSPWKSFYYANADKMEFVKIKLGEAQIPFNETENGFAAQECFAEQIRKIEKEFVPKENSHRENLKNFIDKTIMQSKNFDEFLQKIQKAGYEIKQGKYLAVKPKSAQNFIRVKSLGEHYSEQALRNRLTFKEQYEAKLDEKISGGKDKNSLCSQNLQTQKHYVIVFAANVLPMKKKNKNAPFSWENDKELDKLATLNKIFSEGATLDSLKNKFCALENTVAEKEKAVSNLQKEQEFFKELFENAKILFENPHAKTGEKEKAQKFLSEQKNKKISVTKENYARLQKLIGDTGAEILEKQTELSKIREELKTAAEIFSAAEKIAGGTYVQSLVELEKQVRQEKFIKNGLKNA
jgi:hypothetical protein